MSFLLVATDTILPDVKFHEFDYITPITKDEPKS